MQSGLGGAVVGMRGPWPYPSEGADVDDPTLRRAQVLEGFTGDEERSAGVGLEGGVPLGEGELVEGCGLEETGVINQDVESLVAGDGGCDGHADGGFGADVALDGEGAAAELLDGIDGFDGVIGGGAVGDGDVGTGCGEREGEGAADAFGAAGDEGRLVR